MERPRTMTSRGVALLPLLIMGVCHVSLPPLQAMFEVEPRLMYGWYAIAFILGFVLFRKSRVVKDHEYIRAKAMKKIKHVYEAEERGVWDTNAQLDHTMDSVTKAGLVRSIGEISPEGPEIELDGEERVDVKMLSEAAHVMKANARLSGKDVLDEVGQNKTLGATRRPNPMDRFIDFAASIFGRDARSKREADRLSRLQAASESSPVIAQRPVAPLQTSRKTESLGDELISYSDTGGVQTAITTSGEEVSQSNVKNVEKSPIVPSESLESMAMLGTITSQPVPAQTGVQSCPGCSKTAALNERYCSNCGLDL